MKLRGYERSAATLLLCVVLVLCPTYAAWFNSPLGVSAKAEAANAPSIDLEHVLKLDGGLNALVWSPDGKLLVTSDTFDRRVTIWDYATKTRLHTVHKTYFGQFWGSVTPDGRFVVTSAVSPASKENRISFSLIDIRSGQVVNVEGPDENPEHIVRNIAKKFAIAPSGKYAVTITRAGAHDYLNLYDINSWKLVASDQVAHSSAGRGFTTNALAFNPATEEVALLSVGGLLEIRTPPAYGMGRRIRAHTNSGQAIAFSPDGSTFATAEGTGLGGQPIDPEKIRLWDSRSLHQLAAVAHSSNEDFRARSLSFSPNGRYLVSLNYDGKVRLWDGKSLLLIGEIRDGGERGTIVAFSPDGYRLAIGRNTEVRVMTIKPSRAQ